MKTVIIIALLAGAALLFYFQFQNKKPKPASESTEKQIGYWYNGAMHSTPDPTGGMGVPFVNKGSDVSAQLPKLNFDKPIGGTCVSVPPDRRFACEQAMKKIGK